MKSSVQRQRSHTTLVLLWFPDQIPPIAVAFLYNSPYSELTSKGTITTYPPFANINMPAAVSLKEVVQSSNLLESIM